MTKVHNLKNTSEKPPSKHSSWLEFWKDKSGKEGKKCRNNNCSSDADVGGHVQKHGSQANKDHYITPLCYKCNNKPDGETFDVDDKQLVLINS